MRELKKGFWEDGKFVSVDEYKSIGEIRIIKDTETQRYFVGKEEDTYNPKYNRYDVIGQTIFAIQGEIYDVFSGAGQCLLNNGTLCSSYKDEKRVHFVFITEDGRQSFLHTESTEERWKDAEVIQADSIQKINDLIVFKNEDENVIYHGTYRVVKTGFGRYDNVFGYEKVCIFYENLQIIDVKKIIDYYYFIVKHNKKGLLCLCAIKYDSYEEKYLTTSGITVDELQDAKITSFSYEDIYYDPELERFVVTDNNGLKTVVEKNRLLENTKSDRITKINDLNLYLCYLTSGKVKMVQSDDYLIGCGHYEIKQSINNYICYKTPLEWEKSLIVKDTKKNQYLRYKWGAYGVISSYLEEITKEIQHIKYISFDDYIVKYEDGSWSLFYDTKYLGTYPEGTKYICEERHKESSCKPEYIICINQKKFYNGSEITPVKEKKEDVSHSYTEMTTRERTDLLTDLLIRISSL